MAHLPLDFHGLAEFRDPEFDLECPEKHQPRRPNAHHQDFEQKDHYPHIFPTNSNQDIHDPSQSFQIPLERDQQSAKESQYLERLNPYDTEHFLYQNIEDEEPCKNLNALPLSLITEPSRPCKFINVKPMMIQGTRDDEDSLQDNQQQAVNSIRPDSDHGTGFFQQISQIALREYNPEKSGQFDQNIQELLNTKAPHGSASTMHSVKRKTSIAVRTLKKKPEKKQSIATCIDINMSPTKQNGGGINDYLNETRQEKIERYRRKKEYRNWNKKIAYECRKRVADARLRIKGRFVTLTEASKILGEDVSLLDLGEIKMRLELKLSMGYMLDGTMRKDSIRSENQV